MKKIQVLLWLLLLTACVCTSSEAQTVYITRTGEKYHSSSCRYLRYSKIAISISEAKAQGYTACSVCRPYSDTDSDTSPQSAAPDGVEQSTETTKTVSSQCTATTKAGTRCKRTTVNSNGRCWQHQ